MNSLDYKLSDIEKKDLISCCIIKGSNTRRLYEISPLPYGYMFCFKDNQGYSNSFVVNIMDKCKIIDVLPKCDFTEKLEYFLTEYFKKHK
jgi:hypothetical protein